MDDSSRHFSLALNFEMTIVFHVGYYNNPWNFHDYNDSALGGSERCVVLISEFFAEKHKVFVTGNVKEGVSLKGVRYIGLNNIASIPNAIDLLVGVNYIHFLKYYDSFLITQKWFWMHNTDYYLWYRGEELNSRIYNIKSIDIDKVVCLTNWHKQMVMCEYGVDEHKIQVLPNPVDQKAFEAWSYEQKIPYSFIYTSHAERGLGVVLKEWESIQSKYPEATLHISTPEYGLEYFIENYFHECLKKSGVRFYGALKQRELYTLMAKCQIWYYPTDYDETFCITAKEMMGHGVLPVTSLRAALKEVVGEENNFENYVEAINYLKNKNYV